MKIRASSTSLKNLVTEQFAANSLSGVLQFVIVSAVYFFTYPLLLKSLGPERFGLWAVLGIPSQYVVIGTFGLSNALIKFAAETPTEEASDRLARLVGSATTIFLLVGSAVTVMILICQRSILLWLQISPELLPDAHDLLLGMTCVIFLSLLASVYVSFLSGLHRVDLANMVQTLGSTLNGVGIFVVIKVGWGLIGLMVVYALSSTMTWLMALVLSRRLAHISWSIWPKLDSKTCSSLIGFGSYIYVAGFASVLLEPSLKVLLGHYSGLEAVSSFEIASRVLIQTRSLFMNLMLPLLPASSLLMSNSRAIRSLFGRAMRLLWLTAIPVFVSLSGLSYPLLHVWLGRALPIAAHAMTILAWGWLFNILIIPAYMLVQGINQPRYAMVCSVLQGLISIAVGIVIIPHFGAYGAAAGESVALAVAAIYIWRRYTILYPVQFKDALLIPPSRALIIPFGFACLIFISEFMFHPLLLWQVFTICLGGGLIYALLLFSKSRNGFTALDLLASYIPGHWTNERFGVEGLASEKN